MKLARAFRWRPSRVTVAVLAFMIAGLVVVLVISLAGVYLTRAAATDEAINDARQITDLFGEQVVEPVLDPALFNGDQAALARLDQVVRDRVLNSQIVRVKIWSADGMILYSDEPALIGARYQLGADDLEILERGGTEAEVSDLRQPENRFERRWSKLLEVYRPLQMPDGRPVLFETYLPYREVSALADRVWRSNLPALIGGLLLLYVIEIPLALRLARRVEEGQRQRVVLTRQAAEASERERRRIAADLHDGVVQGLVGSSYALTAAAGKARQAGMEELADTVDRAGTDLRRWVRELRTLLVNVAPPKLHDEGLAAALSDLASTMSARGIRTSVDVEPGLRLRPDVEALVFRAAQEAVRNATSHGAPTNVTLAVRELKGDRVRLEVEDDGRGFAPARRQAAREQGHLGLSLLGALAEDAGGQLLVASEPGQGTKVLLEVPA